MMMISKSDTVCCGQWWPSGFPLPNRRPPGGVIPHPGMVDFAPSNSCQALMPPISRTSGLWDRRPWTWPGHYRPVTRNWEPPPECVMLHRSSRDTWLPLWPLVWMTYSRPPLKPTKEEHGTSPNPEEEAILLRKQTEPLQTPGVEPAKWITTPRSPTPSPIPWPNCLPSSRGRGSVRKIDTDPNHPGQCVCLYLLEHDRVPEWWRELGDIGNVLVQKMACQQATDIRLPAAQQEWYGMWTAPPSLRVLGQRDYLPPADFKAMRDYWEVWVEETVALAKALQRCAINSGMPQGRFVEMCRSFMSASLLWWKEVISLTSRC